jgi:hypothetical protein
VEVDEAPAPPPAPVAMLSVEFASSPEQPNEESAATPAK